MPYSLKTEDSNFKLGDISRISNDSLENNNIHQSESPYIFQMTNMLANGEPQSMRSKAVENRNSNRETPKALQEIKHENRPSPDLQQSPHWCDLAPVEVKQHFRRAKLNASPSFSGSLYVKGDRKHYVSVSEIEAIYESPRKQAKSLPFNSLPNTEDNEGLENYTKRRMYSQAKTEEHGSQDLLGRFRELREKCRELREKEKSGGSFTNKQPTDEEFSNSDEAMDDAIASVEADAHQDSGHYNLMSGDSMSKTIGQNMNEYGQDPRRSLKSNSKVVWETESLLVKNEGGSRNGSPGSMARQAKNKSDGNAALKSKDSILHSSCSRNFIKGFERTTQSANLASAKKGIPSHNSVCLTGILDSHKRLHGSSGLISPQKYSSYQQLSAAKLKRAAAYQYSSNPRRSGVHPSSQLSDNKSTAYATHSVVFWKTESKLLKLNVGSSPRPTPKIHSIMDVPHRKKNADYPSQSYDVIKGKELVRKRYSTLR